MNHQQIANDLIRRMLVLCQNMRKPKSKEEMNLLVDSWARALRGYAYPDFVYVDALSSWLHDASSGDSPPYPGDILRHCKKVIEQFEADPVRKKKLEEYRMKRREEREQRFKDG